LLSAAAAVGVRARVFVFFIPPPRQPPLAGEAGSLWSYTPSTLFTPNPFLARAAVVMEAHLNHAG